MPRERRRREVTMGRQVVPDAQLEAVVRGMPVTFTILDYVEAFQRLQPGLWQELVHRYGLYGSGARYSALTYLSNRLSTYSRRKEANLLKPTPRGWKPEETPSRRRTTAEERRRFGSPWIVIFHRTEE